MKRATDPIKPRESRIPWYWLGLLIIVACAAGLRVRLLDVPLERDEGEYAYAGQMILRGELPYERVYNMKLPGVYYAYAGILAILGETDVAIRLGLILVNTAAIVLLFLLTARLFDKSTGLAAAAAYAVLSLGLTVMGFTANTEHFVVVPALGGVLLLVIAADKKRLYGWFWGGVLLGLAFVMKQHGAAFVLFGAIYWTFIAFQHGWSGWRRSLWAGVVFAAGALLPFGMVCLYLWSAGVFDRFWFWTFTYAQHYVAMVSLKDGLNILWQKIVEIAGSSSILWGLATLGATALFWDRIARKQLLVVGLFTFCSFLAICPGLLFRDHYFIMLLPAVALLAGIGAAACGRLVVRLQPRSSTDAITLVIAGLAVVITIAQQSDYLFELTPRQVSRQRYGSNPFPEAVEIARYIREHSTPEDRIAVIGSEPQIYFYSGRRSATSYIYTYAMVESHPFAQQMQEEMIHQIEEVRPRFLVIVQVPTSWLRKPDSPSLIFTWLSHYAEAYRPVGVADILSFTETVYRWGDDARKYQPRSSARVWVLERQGNANL